MITISYKRPNEIPNKIAAASVATFINLTDKIIHKKYFSFTLKYNNFTSYYQSL